MGSTDLIVICGVIIGATLIVAFSISDATAQLMQINQHLQAIKNLLDDDDDDDDDAPTTPPSPDRTYTLTE